MWRRAQVCNRTAARFHTVESGCLLNSDLLCVRTRREETDELARIWIQHAHFETSVGGNCFVPSVRASSQHSNPMRAQLLHGFERLGVALQPTVDPNGSGARASFPGEPNARRAMRFPAPKTAYRCCCGGASAALLERSPFPGQASVEIVGWVTFQAGRACSLLPIPINPNRYRT